MIMPLCNHLRLDQDDDNSPQTEDVDNMENSNDLAAA